MAEPSGDARARAVRGIEAAAWSIGHAVDAYAVAGGEGARRLGAVLAQANARAKRLDGDGLTAARAALGHAAAGRPTALVVSGDGVIEALPAIREAARVGAPLLLVIPSHGPDVGATLPAQTMTDVEPLRSLAVGVLVASDATQVAEFVLAGLRAAVDRNAPWAVVFEFASIGLSLVNARLPDEAMLSAWRDALSAPEKPSEPIASAHDGGLERHVRDVERFGFALGAAMRDLERRLRHPMAPLSYDGPRDADVVLVSLGAAARAARQAVPYLSAEHGRSVAAVQVSSLRPFPAAELVRLTWRARMVVVHEPMPEPLGVGGVLSDAVRASFADALTWHPGFAGIGRIPPVVTLLGSELSPENWISVAHATGGAGDPPRLMSVDAASRRGGAAETRIEIAMHDAQRENALRLVVEWLSRTGTTVAAHTNEPTRSGIAIARDASVRAPANVLLGCPGGVFEPARLEALAPGTIVVLAGNFPDRVLAETMRAGAPRGIRVATLHAHGASLREEAAVAAVVRLALGTDAAIESALAAAAQEIGLEAVAEFQAQVRAYAEALRAQFA